MVYGLDGFCITSASFAAGVSAVAYFCKIVYSCSVMIGSTAPGNNGRNAIDFICSIQYLSNASIAGNALDSFPAATSLLHWSSQALTMKSR